MLESLEMVGMAKMYTVTLMMGTNDVSRGELRKVMRLHDKMSCILEELRIQMDPAILTVCTIPYNMMADQHAMEMNEKVRVLNGIIKHIHKRSVLLIRMLDVADHMEQCFPEDASSDGIYFDRPRCVERLNDVFQRHINELEADLLETTRVILGPPLILLSLPQDRCPVAWEQESTQEIARQAAKPDYQVPRRWKLKKRSRRRPRVQWYPQW